MATSVLNLGNTRESIEFVAGIVLMEKEGKNLLPSYKDEHIKFSANGRPYEFILRNRRNLDLDSKIKYLSINKNRQINNKIEIKDINMGAMFRIVLSPLTSSTRGITSARPEILISGPKLTYLSVEEISNQEFSGYFSEGKFSEFAVRGKLNELKINDQKTEVATTDEVTLGGAGLNVKIKSTGELVIDGIAQTAQRKSERMNQTRWERLDASVKLLLLSGIFGLISTIFLFVSKCLATNSRVRI